jgi:hypothetical protein
MTKRLTIPCIALTLILYGVLYWITFDRPLAFAPALPLMFATAAILLRRYDPRSALMYSLLGVATTAGLVALTLIHQTESGKAGMWRITAAIFG